MNSTLVLYHANCLDGFGAAYAAWLYLKDSADYIPIQYDTRTNFEIYPRYSRLYIVDFSFPKDYLLTIARNNPGLHIVLIDHHKTAKDDLEGLDHPNIDIILDMGRSGAVLSYKYFFPERDVPELLLAIEDRDLWKFKYPNSKMITSALYPHKKDFELWDSLTIDQLIKEGASILRYQESLVKSIAKHAFRYPMFSIVQTPVLSSEVCNTLLETVPEISFSVAMVDRNAKETQVSLRSIDFDVEDLAKKFGGGGHKSASGFVIPRTSLDNLAKQIQEILTEGF